MTFSQLKVDELRKFADQYLINNQLSSKPSKNEIISALEEEHIEWSAYQKFIGSEDVTEKKENTAVEENIVNKFSSSPVLVKMERQNPTFEIMGFKFTKENPYKVMDEDSAQKIMDLHEGFRLASPREAKEYYN